MAPWIAVKLSRVNANTPRERWKRTKDTNLWFVCDEEKRRRRRRGDETGNNFFDIELLDPEHVIDLG